MPIEVTPQKSAEINARIGQVCRTAASGRELTAQINGEFGLDWHPNTYRRRARDAGYRWPGRKVRRLTPEESQLMDRRLRELCVAGTPGTEIRKILNGEFELHWSFQAYFQRAGRLHLPWVDTPKAGRHLRPVEYLPEAERAACFADPAYEARRGIRDYVICRECFQILHDGGMHGKRGHLTTMEKMSEHQYHLRNPGAPIFTFQRLADQDSRDVDQLMENFAKKYATPEVLAAADSDPKYEVHNDPEHVICRVARCGRKSRDSLKKHLESQHDVRDVAVYRREHNWAPIIAPTAAKKKKQKLSDRNKKQKRKLAQIETRWVKTEDTKARITLAADGLLRGLKKKSSEMILLLYPRIGEGSAENDAKVFFRRNREAIKLEQARLSFLSASLRAAQVGAATSQLNPQGKRAFSTAS